MENIQLITNKDTKSPTTEAYRMIRTNIAFSSVSKLLKKIMLSSCMPGEGKSTTISNLAVVMVQSGYKILLIDCDLRNPTQHKIFRLPNRGVSNYITQGENPEEFIQHTHIENLDLMAAGPVPPNPSELLELDKTKMMFDNLLEKYDYVLIDTPPILPVTDATILSRYADGVIIVMEANANKPEAAMAMKKRLQAVDANILGVVLNKIEMTDVKQYGYGYYYGHSEK